MPESAEIDELLARLLGAGIEFVLVGGGAALIQGAPITTQDVDIVHRRTPDNVQRLHTILRQLDARIIDLAKRRLEPTEQALAGSGQSLLQTSLGRLDVLGTLHDGRGYDELIGHTDVVEFGHQQLRVLDLPTLIEIKASTGRAKDRLMVPVLLQLARLRASEA
jgi:hypothetical protein